jgi:hypothetical protein
VVAAQLVDDGIPEGSAPHDPDRRSGNDAEVQQALADRALPVDAEYRCLSPDSEVG